MNVLIKWIDCLSSIFGKIAAFCCLLLVLITTEQVASRYFFNESSIALQELQWHLFGIIFLCAAAKTLKDDQHVRVDIVYVKLSVRAKAIIDIAGTVFFLLPVSALVVYYGAAYAAEALSFVNPRPADYYTATLFEPGSVLHAILAKFEGFLRRAILIGEISPDPGGLEARWIIKAVIPFSFLLIILQGIAELIRNVCTLASGKAPERRSSSHAA